MLKTISIIVGAIIIIYPLVVYWGVSQFGVGGSAAVISCLFLFRLFCSPSSAVLHKYLKAFRLIALLGFLFAVSSWLMNDTKWFQFYPVFVNLILLSVFCYSLIKPPTVVEMFARFKEPDLSESGIKYTRNVTIVWCAFFLINGLVALYTVIAADIKVWAFYNGFISYLLIGALAVGEYSFRIYYRKRSSM